MSVSYSDMTAEIDAIPMINKEDSTKGFEVSQLLRLELFQTGY